MKRARFALSSDQLELLLAFGEAQGLNQLAERMGKDPSVVSRGLQRIAEIHPVLEKVKGRWVLTPLGRETNNATTDTILRYRELLERPPKGRKEQWKATWSKRSVLVIVNAQCGLLDATQPGRNNSEAEKNITSILQAWRTNGRPIVHVRHVSENPESVFYRHAPGCEFLLEARPASGEFIIEKSKSSAFADTSLEEGLGKLEPDHLVLVGFTANECIDATARDASSLGFSVYVVGDATAMFDLRGPDGKLVKAERLHKLTLANIHALYAKVIHTSDAQ